MTTKSAGDQPPKGQDMNQILYELSAIGRWFSAGALNTYDFAFSTSIGGYPKGAYVIGDDLKTIYRCTVGANTNNPNSVNTGWTKVAFDIAEILLLGTAAYRDVGTGSGQIPDMSSYTFTGDANKFVIQFPGGFCIQGGKASTDANGFTTVNLGLAMSTYSVVVGEGFVSNWVESGNVYSGLVVYGAQILDASSFGFRSIWWQGASKTFQGAQATAQWMAYGKI